MTITAPMMPVATYQSFTLQKREAALSDPRVIELRKTMPSDVETLMIDAFRRGDHSDGVEKVYDHFVNTSDIAKAIVDDKGGADIFYYLYNKKGSGPLDQYYLKSGAGHQIYRRLKVMEEQIPIMLRRLFPDGDIVIDNIASGQGYDMINVLANPKNVDLRKRTHVRNVDPNEPALDAGWQRVVEYELEDNFENVVGTIGDYVGRDADFMIGSGIYCPFGMALCIRTQKRSFTKIVKPNGYCLYNATTMKMIEGDPFTDFTMRLLGWYMGFKTISDIKAIATRAGWAIDSVFFDTDDDGQEVGYNQMVVAQNV